ncbi:MAG: hypothetical protein E6J06_00695 [Chloroflexi bacterium]|nr:MAG: hypothetical protein E6J06_00695 [Chloroflexota bacterium]
MPTPLQLPPKIVFALALMLAVAGCQPGANPRAVPSVPQMGADLKCSKADHPYEDPQAGWGFCYPAGWKYVERSQATQSPPGLDLTFDITDATCASPAAGVAPQCSPDAGLFGFMIISTYERGSSADLTSWLDTNLTHPPANDPISWGNSLQAVRLADGRRVALTPHHVVILELHPSPLDLETQMSSRLATWKFSY